MTFQSPSMSHQAVDNSDGQSSNSLPSATDYLTNNTPDSLAQHAMLISTDPLIFRAHLVFQQANLMCL